MSLYEEAAERRTPITSIEEVEREVAFIASVSDDPEHAHVLEDRLMRQTLELIAKDEGGCGALARAALGVTRIKYRRWYA